MALVGGKIQIRTIYHLHIIIDKVTEKDVIIKSHFIFCTGYMNYIIVLTDFIVILQ